MSPSIRVLLINFSSVLFVLGGKAQNYFYNQNYYEPAIVWEIGLSAGMMNCLTDLGGNKGPGRLFIKDINIKNTRFCAGAYAHAIYNYIIGGRIEFTTGRITASDSILINDYSIARYRYKRNLHFRSVIKEVSIMGEWYFLSQWMQKKQLGIPLFSPYLIAGVSLFHFDPEAKLDNNWVMLHPLHTEGQGFPEFPKRNNYSCTQFNFPAGMGIRYEISALFNLQIEVVHRILLTDYLDDVSTRYVDPSIFDKYLDATQSSLAKELSDRRAEIDPLFIAQPDQQRGNAANKDSYFSLAVKFGWVINRTRRQ